MIKGASIILMDTGEKRIMAIKHSLNSFGKVGLEPLVWKDRSATAGSVSLSWSDANLGDTHNSLTLQQYSVVVKSISEHNTENSGNVVYDGTHPECLVTGLLPEHRYHFHVTANYLGSDREIHHSSTSVLEIYTAPKIDLPAFVELDKGIIASAHGLTVTKTSSGRFAISEPLSRADVFWWRTKICHMTDNKWIFLGIILTNTQQSISHASPSSYGWSGGPGCGRGQVWCQGSSQGSLGKWEGWMSGDIGIFRFDRKAGTLKMKHPRTNHIYEIENVRTSATGNPEEIAAAEWRLQVNFLESDDSVQFLPPEPGDMF